MITPEVVSFIKGQDAKGVSREATRALLASQGGWSQENLDEAFAAVPLVFAAPNDKTPNPPPPIVVQTASEPKRSNPMRPFLIAGGLVALLLVGAGAAYALVPAVRHQAQFLVASPEERVALSMQKLITEADRYQVMLATEMYNDVHEGSSEYADMLARSRAASEVVGVVERIEGDASSLPARVHSTFTYTVTGLGEPMTLHGEAYADPAMLLVKFTDTVDLLFFTTEPVTGKWISLLEGSAEGIASPIGGELITGIAAGYSVYRDTVGYLAERAPEYLVVEDTGDVRAITGEKSRRYMVTIDAAALESVMQESPLIMSDRVPLDTRESLKERLPELLADIGDNEPMELWISERTHYPVKWRMTQRTPSELAGTSYAQVVETTGTVSIEAVDPIVVPEKDLTIDEAFTLIMNGARRLFDS